MMAARRQTRRNESQVRQERLLHECELAEDGINVAALSATTFNMESQAHMQKARACSNQALHTEAADKAIRAREEEARARHEVSEAKLGAIREAELAEEAQLEAFREGIAQAERTTEFRASVREAH